MHSTIQFNAIKKKKEKKMMIDSNKLRLQIYICVVPVDTISKQKKCFLNLIQNSNFLICVLFFSQKEKKRKNSVDTFK